MLLHIVWQTLNYHVHSTVFHCPTVLQQGDFVLTKIRLDCFQFAQRVFESLLSFLSPYVKLKNVYVFYLCNSSAEVLQKLRYSNVLQLRYETM